VNVVESRYNYAVEELYSSLPLLAEYVADVGDVGMFHASMQSKWNMPAEYKEFDIVEHVVSLCTTECELIRVKDELIMFLDRGFESLLKFLKFFVDECKKRNIVLGVGRGSSVSSYVLYLLGVHRVNSIEYGLDINEFLR
jgi:DNA polymerase III alpha subunit